MEGPLVSAGWLREHAAEVRVVDVRWRLGEPGRGRALYEEGHVPGAVFLDVDTDLADLSKPGPGRHPMPDPERFVRTVERVGIGDDTIVVAYDDAGGAHAARLWWLLWHHGHRQAHLLDGGLPAWVAAGGALAREVPAWPRGRFTLRPPLVGAIHRDEVRASLGRLLLLDARTPERYEGRVEPLDPRAGHIPGAKNAPYPENLDPRTSRLLPPEVLRRRYEALGAGRAETVACYCGSGVTACHDVLAMVVAGFPPPLLYPGSWSDWSRDAEMPIETGRGP